MLNQTINEFKLIAKERNVDGLSKKQLKNLLNKTPTRTSRPIKSIPILAPRPIKRIAIPTLRPIKSIRAPPQISMDEFEKRELSKKTDHYSRKYSVRTA